MGAYFDDSENHKYTVLRVKGYRKNIRLARLGDEYSLDRIKERIYDNRNSARLEPFQKGYYHRPRQYVLLTREHKIRKVGGLYGLYLHYCYLLGYLPKHTDYKPTSPYLKEDLRKLDELSEQVRYMGKYDIETFDDLYADREKIQRNMDALIARRTKLQNRIRRAAPAEKEILRQEKAGVTEQITTLRKQLKLNQGIEARSVQIQERTDLLYANEYRAKEAQQQKKAQRRERDAR